MNVSDSERDAAENEATLQALHEQDSSLSYVSDMIHRYESEIAAEEARLGRTLNSTERHKLLEEMQEEEMTREEVPGLSGWRAAVTRSCVR